MSEDIALLTSSNHYMCIYALIAPNGKIYIGQARNFFDRQISRKRNYYHWRMGIKNGENIRGENPKLFRAFLKYGIENFKVEIIEENLNDTEELNEIEEYYINFYDSVNNGYNISTGGGVYINPNTGRSYFYGKSEYTHNRTDEPSEYKKEWYFSNRNHENNLKKRREYRLANLDKEMKIHAKHREVENKKRILLRKFMVESDSLMYGVKLQKIGKCVRQWFGGGRTRSLNFIAPKGIINEQGCWLYC